MLRAALLPFFLIVLQANAQNDLLDSLWRSYRSQPKGADRLVTLHEFIFELRSLDVDSSLVVSRRMLVEAKSLNDPLTTALAYRNIGLGHLTERLTDSALTFLHLALDHYRLRSDSAFHRGAGATLSSMGMAYKMVGKIDEAMKHYHESIRMHKLANDPEGIVYCYSGMGRIWEVQGRNDSALYYYQLSGELAAELKMDLMEGGAYGNLANVHAAMGNIGQAIDMAYRSLGIMERIVHRPGIAACLTTISSLKHALGEKEEALQDLRRAYALYDEADYKQGLMTAGSTIGTFLMELDRPDSAVIMLERSLELMRQAEAKDLIGRTLRSLGNVYRQIGEYDRSRSILEEALILAAELDDVQGRSTSLSLLGRTFLEERKATKAIESCTKGLEEADRNDLPEARRDACECLYLAYKATGNGSKALHFHERYIEERDRLVNAESERKLTQRDLMYTFSKQQLADSLRYAGELVQLENERTIEKLRADQNRNRMWATSAGALLLIGGGGSVFMADRKRRKERFEKEAATLETQALRSQMNPHFIFNALNSINAYVQRNDQDMASSYLSKFARVMRLVLENSRHAEVPLNDDLEALRGYLDLERMRMDKRFDFSIEVDPEIDPEEVMVPPLVVQPFVENAIWHGMAGIENEGRIKLSVAKRGEQLVWTIEDNGAGRSAKKMQSDQPVKKTSLGTAITRARLDLVQKQHGGEAGFHYTDLPQGTRVEVQMPLLSAY